MTEPQQTAKLPVPRIAAASGLVPRPPQAALQDLRAMLRASKQLGGNSAFPDRPSSPSTGLFVGKNVFRMG